MSVVIGHQTGRRANATKADKHEDIGKAARLALTKHAGKLSQRQCIFKHLFANSPRLLQSEWKVLEALDVPNVELCCEPRKHSVHTDPWFKFVVNAAACTRFRIVESLKAGGTIPTKNDGPIERSRSRAAGG